MNSKYFSLKQIFSIVDGRLSGTMDDVYGILNHCYSANFPTTLLPSAAEKLRGIMPTWYIQANNLIVSIKEKLETNDFKLLMAEIDKNYSTVYFNVPQLTTLTYENHSTQNQIRQNNPDN